MHIPAEPQPDKPLSARWGADIVRCLRAFRLVSSPDMDVTTLPGGTTARPRQQPGGGAAGSEPTSFDKSLAGAVCTIAAGSIRLHGIGNYAVAEADVTLTGAVEWVYVEQVKATPATTSIKHSATEPESNTAYRRLPLYKFEAISAGKYRMVRKCHEGDFNFDTPL